MVNGDEGDDVILGNGGGDELFGGLDNDKIKGQGGVDVADTLIGGGGKDEISDGDDKIKGGGGSDTFLFADGADGDVINGFSASNDVMDFSGSATVTTFADLTIEGCAEGAEVSSAEGVIVTLANIEAAAIDEDDFIFG